MVFCVYSYSYDYVKSMVESLAIVFDYEKEHSDTITKRALELFGLYRSVYTWLSDDDVLIASVAAAIIVIEEVPMFLLENDQERFNAPLIKDMIEYCGKEYLIGTKVKTVKERPYPVNCPRVI